MKITTLILAVCVLVSIASCARTSSNPQKDIVGNWERLNRRSDSDLVELQLKDNGSCWYRVYFDPPNGTSCSYKLITDSSGSMLAITTTPDPLLGFKSRASKWKVQVYENVLVVNGLSLTRASK